MSNATFPIVTIAMARPFAVALEKSGIPAGPVLSTFGLDPGKLADEAAFIPAASWYEFAEAAADVAGDTTFGFKIGNTTDLNSLPNLRVLVLNQATLGELLTALVIDVHRFSTIADYTLSTDGNRASLVTRRRFVPPAPPRQIDGYFTGFMLRILRLCAGAGWTPEAVELHLCDPSALPKGVRARLRVKRAGTGGAAFHFPAGWLLQGTDGIARQARLKKIGMGETYLDAFSAMLDLHLEKQGLTLQAFARLTGQSASAIKRRLREMGTTYQTQLDRRRAALARFLLEGTDLPAGQIGARLGYPDPPSFSRAFRRWTGTTTARYRSGAR